MEKRLFKSIVLFIAWSCSTGCVTKRLWEDKAFNEPSPTPNVRLFYSEAKGDVLVTYDELCDATDRVHRRGYYLMENSNRPLQQGKPEFVDVAQTNRLHEIQVFARENSHEPSSNSFAVLDTTATSFDLTLNSKHSGPHELPVYPSGFQVGTQIALTPAAVVADAVIVGSVVGIVVAYWYAYAYGSNYRH